MPKVLQDSFSIPEKDCQWTICEKDSSGVVDGVNILARVVGPFFIVEGSSRNGRYYTKKLWETAISKHQSLMEAGQMIGTIGHETALDDKAMMEGRGSHRVTKLWIDEKTGLGMGEVLVLNTSAGRELNGYLRGGVNFPVSSRAVGEFTGKQINGADEIDPESYVLEGFDFVRVPGVKEALPRLVESENGNEDDNLGVSEMGEQNHELLSKVTAEKVQVEADLQKALDDLSTMKENYDTSKNQTKYVEKEVSTLKEALEAKETEIKELKEKLEKFESVDLDDVQEKLEEAKETEEALDKLGSLDGITLIMEKLSDLSDKYGKLTDMEQRLEATEAFANVSELEEALEELEEFKTLGDSFADVKEALELAASAMEELEEASKTDNSEKLAEKLNVSLEEAGNILEKMDYDTAVEFYESVVKKDDKGVDVKRFKKDKPSIESMTESDDSDSDDDQEDINENTSRVSTLFKRML